MSGTNFTRIVACTLLSGLCFALSWQHDQMMPNSRQEIWGHPAVFPDTMCVALSWSPIYRDFGIQEGLAYIGTDQIDLSIKTQYHRLMSNHQISIGFPILKEKAITAGLQLHYTLSALHGVENQHKGSCSGGLIIRPQAGWQVSLYSMHILTFPMDSTEHLLEPNLAIGFIATPLPSIELSILCKKSAHLPWRGYLGFRWQAMKALAINLFYEMGMQHITLSLELSFNRWSASNMFTLHSYLGLTQEHTLLYEY